MIIGEVRSLVGPSAPSNPNRFLEVTETSAEVFEGADGSKIIVNTGGLWGDQKVVSFHTTPPEPPLTSLRRAIVHVLPFFAQ
jgi:hypothetical protein